MRRWIYCFTVFSVCSFAHPVSYTIDLLASYDRASQEVKIDCKSSSRNKCGLHNFRLLDENGDTVVDKKFPFLKKSIKVKSKSKPKMMVFYLRKTPEHLYNISVE